MSLHEIIALALAGVGCVFTLLGAIGVFRMPDVFMRMSTSAKASTLGVTSLVLASAVFHAELSLTVLTPRISRMVGVTLLSVA